MMSATPLPAADILIVTAADEFLGEPGAEIDPLWDALRAELGMGGLPAPYMHLTGQYLSELRTHKVFAEQRDRFPRLHPRLRHRHGAFVTGAYCRRDVNGRSVVAFVSDLRLNTDGPAMPAVRLIAQIVREVRPRLVVHAGLGAGARAEHQAGDVAVASAARFALSDELAGSALDGQTFGGIWKPDPALFDGLSFVMLQEPPLLAPSPHYEAMTSPQPPPHRPRVVVEELPVITRPIVTRALMEIPSPDAGDAAYWGHVGCALDMDAAPTAAACKHDIPCSVVIGTAVPAIKRFPYDYDSRLRHAWAEVMLYAFGQAAALNVARTVRRIVEQAPLD